MTRRKLYRRKAWGGFVGGKLTTGFEHTADAWEARAAIFTSKVKAKRTHEDVRRVEIRELPTPKRKARS